MIELGQLERRYADFDRRNTQVVVASVEGLDAARQTQEDFPHLVVVSDERRELTNVADVIHPHSAPDGGDTSAPAVVLVDRQGTVRWTSRPERFLDRLSPDELLAAIEQHMPAER
jgi:alkyl hydroperoxide reductase subunit AhpC